MPRVAVAHRPIAAETVSAKILPMPALPSQQRRAPRSWRLRRIVGDLARLANFGCAISGAGIGLAFLAHQTQSHAMGPQRILPLMGTILALLALRARERNSDPHASAEPLVGPSVASAVIVGLMLAATGEPAATLWLPIMMAALGAGFASALSRLGIEAGLSRDDVAPKLRRCIAIYGASAEAERLMTVFAMDRDAVHCVGVFEDRQRSRIDAKAPACTGRLSDLETMIRHGLVDEVIIALPRAAGARITEIADQLRRYPVDIHVCTHMAEEFPLEGPSELSSIAGAGLLRLHRRPIDTWGDLAKTALDHVVAAVLLVLLAPLFAIVAAAIKLESPGPAFFKQRRHGLMNETITVWKFRSMRTMDDGPKVVQASKGDPRITKVGGFLRKSSLDELPQLINVLLGEMSLVGPRPHAIAHNELYSEVIATYSRRHQVKPGITGWAQVNGYRGETPTTAIMEKRVEHDLWYIRNWSIWLDFKILLLTPIYGFVNRNAY